MNSRRLIGGSARELASLVAAFHRGLNETAYFEGRNVAFEYRWANGRYDHLPALAADLVRRQVTAIAALGSVAPALAAKAATSLIPIVFQTGSDPVQGLVTSMNRPGGNITGVSRLSVTLGSKRLELLHELVPQVTAIAILINPTNRVAQRQLLEMQEAARFRGVNLIVVKASIERELEAAFATLVQQRAGALLVTNDPFFVTQRKFLVALAAIQFMPLATPPPVPHKALSSKNKRDMGLAGRDGPAWRAYLLGDVTARRLEPPARGGFGAWQQRIVSAYIEEHFCRAF